MLKVSFIRQTVVAAFVVAAISFAGCKKDKDPDPVSVSGVSLNKSELTLIAGGSETLTATVAPADAANKAVTWSSSDAAVASVASVDAEGKVTAVKAGTATITVTTADGGKTATCAVTVTAAKVAVTGVSLDKPTLTLLVGASETLAATVAPEEATNKTVTWKSSDETVAGVSDAGVVTAIAKGTATITVTTNDGGKTATCAVTVNTPPAITMTTAKSGEVSFYVLGTGDAVINWGDGSAPETVTLQTYYNSDVVKIHTFADATSRTITIDGQNITNLFVRQAGLTALDVSNSTALTSLDCVGNLLTSLDVSKNTALRGFMCNVNQITSLDVSKNTELTDFRFSNNQITSIDLSNNTKLMETLYCNGNKLTSLDVSSCPHLKGVGVYDNLLDAEALNALFGTLSDAAIVGSRTIIIRNNPGAATCDQSIATAKGWTVTAQ